jgi:hypothetical protein
MKGPSKRNLADHGARFAPADRQVTCSEFARIPKLARGRRLGEDSNLDQVPRARDASP